MLQLAVVVPGGLANGVGQRTNGHQESLNRYSVGLVLLSISTSIKEM
jgi:hypothetical protein